MQQELTPHMEEMVNIYYENEARKLRYMVDTILRRLKFHDIEKTDFYSLANEIFVSEVLENYDEEKSFDSFLYSCLYNKICSQMTKTKRYKRCNKVKIKVLDENGNEKVSAEIIQDYCIDAPLSGVENCTLGDSIKDKVNMYDETEGYSKKMTTYLNRLSSLQKKVLNLISIGYKPYEIKEILNITDKKYNDCLAAIHSCRNNSVLL